MLRRSEPNPLASVQAMIRFIDYNRGYYGLEPICKLLPIAPSTYYSHVTERQGPSRMSACAQRDILLKPEVTRVLAQNFGVYGVRKVWRQMKREGYDMTTLLAETINGLYKAEMIHRRGR